MPFQSKAQQRLFFAKNPEKAKEWAKETPNMSDLPEKKHPQTNPKRHELSTKIASDGMFFQKMAKAKKGHFFRDMPGRDDALFHEKAAFTSYEQGQIPSGGGINVSAGGMSSGGEDSGGGMYGTGGGKKSDADRLKAVLAKGKDATKTAGTAPSDWDAAANLPTGFHRPASQQPETLEAGGERFHSSEARPPDFGAPGGQRHGVVEGGSVHTRATASPQMGKHATPMYLGTSFEKRAMKYTAPGDYANRAENYASERAGEAKKSLQSFGSGALEKADEAVKGITKSPVATTVAALVAAKLGLRGVKGVARGAGKLVGIRRRPPPTATGHVLGGLRKLITGR